MSVKLTPWQLTWLWELSRNLIDYLENKSKNTSFHINLYIHITSKAYTEIQSLEVGRGKDKE